MKALSRHVLLACCIGSAAVLSSACAPTEDRPSTGQYIDDSAITAKVKVKLLEDPLTKGLKINVSTFKGEVQLSGFIESKQAKDRAEELAKSVGGVKSVKNNLEIKGN